MKYLVPLIFCTLCVLMVIPHKVCAGSNTSVFVHFVVLPVKQGEGGENSPALNTFRAEMIMLAGGYSELGPSLGGSLHPEGVVSKENISYLVSADRDISLEIRKVVNTLFGLEKAFILVWPAQLVR
ncbi:hypothetical protein [Pseudodesulfovibrio piezophilus]|uniref:Lipoprotein n=1 Tax=Pseudodesulfovibrio piezophilus (strain DSM 21447 / JCM 15486 / C1TLV30) TaxID=1322246 RepID=M1WR09_PSEP2|nr:hypothetical protein [Pseudodesulfovibrio piezophilus]CCH48017.1 conserved exported protein of unknown function [Pseudodesulfovibrio piezophilus C1TLV30]